MNCYLTESCEDPGCSRMYASTNKAVAKHKIEANLISGYSASVMQLHEQLVTTPAAEGLGQIAVPCWMIHHLFVERLWPRIKVLQLTNRQPAAKMCHISQ